MVHGEEIPQEQIEFLVQSSGFDGAVDIFREWIRSERAQVWADAVNHLEAVLGPEMKRAAHADNPYLPEDFDD